jgi:hypothetical protein
MSYRISDTLEKIANGLGIARDNLQAAADRFATEYPDAESREKALVAWIHANADTALDPLHLANTIIGIAKDIIAGQGGTDPKAFAGNV